MPLSTKSFHSICNVFEGIHNKISWLDVSRCNLQAIHMTSLSEFLPTAKNLNYLDISGNVGIGDLGAAALAIAVQGKQDAMGRHNPPLRHFDASNCGLGPIGSKVVTTAGNIPLCILQKPHPKACRTIY